MKCPECEGVPLTQEELEAMITEIPEQAKIPENLCLSCLKKILKIYEEEKNDFRI